VCRVLNEISGLDKNRVLIVTDNESDIQEHRLEFPNLKLQAFNQNRFALVRHLLRLLFAPDIDLALIGHVNYAPLGWLMKKVRPKLRYGVMLYGIDAWEELPPFKKFALQRADFMISISDYTKQRAIEANALIQDRIFLLPNALEQDTTEGGDAIGTPSTVTGTRLLTVCRLEQSEKYKGVDRVIEALPAIARRLPDIEYVVIGGGTDVERHKELAQKLGVASRVQFLGFVTDQILRAHYRDCDVFVMPSEREGFGFVFLEAMQYAKPVVAARSGGTPEVVEDRVTGRLVEYGNVEELTEALLALCLDSDKRKQLGAMGYQRLQENFSFPLFKDKLTEILLQELPPELKTARQLSVGETSQTP